ncbi:MAG TPA: helix-turn-helix transcriptional regulator, partial [Marmoricola sp.]|nr:helix-turn-helix transcriptional regulator [Marmoricola sp.]
MSTSSAVDTENQDGFAVLANNRLSALLGVASASLAIAYFGRAVDGGGVVDVLATLLFGAIGIHQLWTVFDARVPLVTADETIVRVRLGREWLGLPWSTIEQIVVEHRDGRIRDGRLVIVPRNLGNALEALPPGARRTVAWQKRLHGAPLTVPLSIATRNLGVHGSVADTLKYLSRDRAEIVLVNGRAEVEGPEVSAVVDRVPPPVDPDEPTIAVDRKQLARAIAPVAAARVARPVFRAEVMREKSRQMPGVAQAVRDAAADAITPINAPRIEIDWSSNGGVVPADRLYTRAVANPVIGPTVRAARERAGLSVDALSERTAIRPHVLEGIEIDDFHACGGDFYARGHLRTLARFLGLNPGDLVETYDEHYARAPISARRVFEAE